MKELLDKYEGEHERCGIVLKNGAVIELKNIAPNPENAFYADPEGLIPYLDGDQIAATWHTHPHATSNLSPGDYETFQFWPHCKHYIVGSDGITTYVVRNNAVIKE